MPFAITIAGMGKQNICGYISCLIVHITHSVLPNPYLRMIDIALSALDVSLLIEAASAGNIVLEG